MIKTLLAAILAVGVIGCSPKYKPIMKNGDYIGGQTESVVAKANRDGQAERARLADAQGQAQAAALANCTPAICAAVTRGELALGMDEAQVLAASRTTPDAWEIRGSAEGKVMTPRIGTKAPSDAVSEIAFVGFQNGKVVGYTYRESQGFRNVSSPQDASAKGIAAAKADALVAEGDRAAAAGDLDAALDFYDRADVIRSNHAETTLRIARILDKQNRGLEALMRYQLFLHQMEIEKIDAHGRAAGHLAEAIAQARQRIIYLERYR